MDWYVNILYNAVDDLACRIREGTRVYVTQFKPNFNPISRANDLSDSYFIL